MSNFWFTSDTHYGHNRIIELCSRPFSCIKEMDEAMIQNWNSVVQPGDTVYHLGDFAFDGEKRINSILSRLNGNKFLCLGNHDDRRVHQKCNFWSTVWERKDIKIGNDTVVISHYAQRTWNGVYHFFGHTHGSMEPYGRSCDVGVDSWGFTPVNFETLKSLLSKQPEISHHASKEIWKGIPS